MSEPGDGNAASVRLVVRREHAGTRLDQWLAAVTPLSRRRARTLIAAGAVRRNGEPVRVQGRALGAGDVLDLPAEELPGFAPWTPPPVDVLLDDGWLLAVNKPAGVLSQPAEEGGPRGLALRGAGGVAPPLEAAHLAEPEPRDLAMDDWLLLRLAWQEGRPPFLRLVHRLDRNTTGVLLFARRPAATEPLARAWREGKVERGYLAVVEGEPAWETREVEAPIARVAGGAWRFEVSPRGERAATTVRVRAATSGIALVECFLRTGRTHQARVHLAHLGHPVMGDRLYGARRDAPRPLLHAAWLALPHPRDGAMTRVEAPLPADLASRAPASA
jgi:23S rRNA pseudouridine1911/1915/1917 synthase